MRVVASVAEHDDGGSSGHRRRVFCEELPEDAAVVGVGVDVDHVTAEDQPERPLGGMVTEQLGGLGDPRYERERPHLGEQVLQAVHQIAG